MRLWHILAVSVVVAACAAPIDLPEEAQDADGIGGATAKVEFIKWMGQLILTAVGNITVNVKVENGSTDSRNSDKPGAK